MKKVTLITLLLILAVSPMAALAGQNNVTISWEMYDTDGITGYTVYYAFSSDMANQQVACQTNNPSATQVSCSDVNITSFPVYFTVAANKDSGGETCSAAIKGPIPTPKNLHIVE